MSATQPLVRSRTPVFAFQRPLTSLAGPAPATTAAEPTVLPKTSPVDQLIDAEYAMGTNAGRTEDAIRGFGAVMFFTLLPGFMASMFCDEPRYMGVAAAAGAAIGLGK